MKLRFDDEISFEEGGVTPADLETIRQRIKKLITMIDNALDKDELPEYEIKSDFKLE